MYKVSASFIKKKLAAEKKLSDINSKFYVILVSFNEYC